MCAPRSPPGYLIQKDQNKCRLDLNLRHGEVARVPLSRQQGILDPSLVI